MCTMCAVCSCACVLCCVVCSQAEGGEGGEGGASAPKGKAVKESAMARKIREEVERRQRLEEEARAAAEAAR